MGHYMVDWVVNELVSRRMLSPPALNLWLHLKGLSWEGGACDATDERLAGLMGGVTTEAVRVARRELRARHLLVESSDAARGGDAGVRWLVPLPVLAGLRSSLPAGCGERAVGSEAQLRKDLVRLRSGEAEHVPGPPANLPQAVLGANSPSRRRRLVLT